jgi:lipoprotein-releasing system permease protein
VYKLFLTLRYLRKRRIAYFAIAAVTLCTAMVLIVMSVMGGFLDQLKFKARGLLGDIIVDNKSYSGFPLYEEFIADISKWPEIVKATPVLYAYGLLRFEGTPQTATVQVVGLRLADVYEVNAFKSSLYYEKYYPGTTTLAEQQQPLLGFDLNAPPIEWRDERGRPIGMVGPPFLLPPQYQAALEKSWAAGVVDTETVDSDWSATMQAAHLPPVVGEYRAVDGIGPPAMTGDPHPGLIIGRDIVAMRQADGRYERYSQSPRGCLVTVTLLPATESGTLDTPVKPVFRYADDSRTGIYEIDSKHVYCDFGLLQKLLHMDQTQRVDPDTGAAIGTVPARCSQIQIKIAPGVDARALTVRLQEYYRGLVSDPRFEANLSRSDMQLIARVDAMTWAESQAHIIAPVEKERQLVSILFGIISLVAAVLVLCILYMIVLQKTRDIGIVKSIGGSPLGVAAIFIAYGSAIGVVGSAVGSVAGYYFVTYINTIQDWLTAMNPSWQVWDRSVYSFDEIPHTVRTFDLVLVIVSAIVLATLGSLLAARRAGLMQPVEALRYE